MVLNEAQQRQAIFITRFATEPGPDFQLDCRERDSEMPLYLDLERHVDRHFRLRIIGWRSVWTEPGCR